MLLPAILYREEIRKKMQEYYYTDDMLYETGSLNNWLPEISDNPAEDLYEYAVVDNKDKTKLIGFISYRINFYSSCANCFGIISFDKNNLQFGIDLRKLMNTIINSYHIHRIEWRMVGGNPVEKHYDKFCEKYNGNKYILHDALKDRQGIYHDDIIYEIIFDNK